MVTSAHTERFFVNGVSAGGSSRSAVATVSAGAHTGGWGVEMSLSFPVKTQVASPADGVELPTTDERTAFNLRKTLGLSDEAIGAMMGGIRRETVCRLRGRFEKKRAALVRLCAGGDCTLLTALAG
jgi:hypothetical protein